MKTPYYHADRFTFDTPQIRAKYLKDLLISILDTMRLLPESEPPRTTIADYEAQIEQTDLEGVGFELNFYACGGEGLRFFGGVQMNLTLGVCEEGTVYLITHIKGDVASYETGAVKQVGETMMMFANRAEEIETTFSALGNAAGNLTPH